MNVTVIGATGRTGRELVAQAVHEGHRVTAVARHPDGSDPRINTVQVDFCTPDRHRLAQAVTGADVVLSALGPRSKNEAGIVTTGTELLINAMDETGARRLEIISAAPVRTPADIASPPPDDSGGDWLNIKVLAPIVRRLFGYVYQDLAQAEERVADSDLDWTIVRPPRLIDAAESKQYRTDLTANLKGGRSISRADLARFMVSIMSDADTLGQRIRIAY